MTAAEIRELTRAEIEPHIPTLIADGFTPEIDEGTWLGAFVDGTLAGFVRVFQEDGAWMLEDVMVFSEFRRRGLAAELIRHAREGLDHLWLICDDPMIRYYEALGFSVAPKPDFPEPLATLYTAKKEWPTGSDHNHNAMRWPARLRTVDKPGRKRAAEAESGSYPAPGEDPGRNEMRIASHRTAVAAATAVLVIVALAMGTASAANPADEGAWTAPFEEGGSGVPRCQPDPNGPEGQVVCKPTAVGAAVLPSGQVWYANGLEATENIRYAVGFEIAPRSRNSLSGILSLLSGTPVFSPLTQPPLTNPQINPGSTLLEDPNGTLGVPGQPGTGLSGSFWGMLGLPGSADSDPPDDVQDNDADLFCSDQAQLADGSILIAGGTDYYNEPAVLDRDRGDPVDLGIGELEGTRISRIFNPATGTYHQTGHMKFGRWYPGLVTLSDGKVSVFSGVTKLVKAMQGSNVRRTETFDPATKQWTENYVDSSSEASLPLFPRLFLMPNNKVLYSGVGQTWSPEGQAMDEILWAFQQFWNPATSKWEQIGLAPLGAIGGAPEVMLALEPPYDRATVMSVGGTLLPSPGSYFATPFTTYTTVTADGAVTAERGPDLNNRRWYSSAVTLPTGEVATFSGALQDEVNMTGFELPVRQAELYNPATKTWSTMASGGRDRTYHNSAVLLPDGRVLVGGHAPIPSGVGYIDAYGAHHDLIPGVTANNDRDPSFEVFSPPYLFRGPRPAIAAVQSGIAWGSSFTIGSPSASSVTQVVLSRLPSAQHITDSDARTIRLAFSKSGTTITAAAPPSGVIAPPGYYYLFVINGSGVPSVARIVNVGGTSDATPTVNVYGTDNPPAPSGGSATEPTDSSYINQPPPLPVGGMVVGLVAAGAGLPALRRRFTEEDAS